MGGHRAGLIAPDRAKADNDPLLHLVNAAGAIPDKNKDLQLMEVRMLRTAMIATLAATPARADYGHMMGWGYDTGVGMILGPVLWVLVVGLVVFGVVWFVRQLDQQPKNKVTPSALAELDLRFARGEIDAEEYASRKKHLQS